MNHSPALHPITIEPHPGRVVVRLNGAVVADSHAALCLREAGYPPVYYLPRGDVSEAALAPDGHRSHCPYKGDASYWTLRAGGGESVAAAWSYEQPMDTVAAIAGHLAFYPDRVDAIEVG